MRESGLTLAWRILRGYGRTARWIIVAAAVVALVAAVAAAIVFPLWYLSTKERTLYTVVVLLACAGGIAYLIYRRISGFLASPPAVKVQRLKAVAMRIAAVIAGLVLAYVIIGLYVFRLFAVAVPLSIIYLVAAGYLLYAQQAPKQDKG